MKFKTIIVDKKRSKSPKVNQDAQTSLEKRKKTVPVSQNRNTSLTEAMHQKRLRITNQKISKRLVYTIYPIFLVPYSTVVPVFKI